ncbi:MAG TPA: Lpg1974 family pore-forming outer membrane protein [Chlamydiales bacterium]|nr:Lpg1974 family pore-forming outer membrane protein [Chlamydiales bacterium]
MKRLIIALTLFFSTGLPAAQECPPTSPCCPSPQPPICCECYVPSYYDLQCDLGVFIYGDFLYWFARENDLSPCMTVTSQPTLTPNFINYLAAVNTNQFETKWAPGFRVGLGYNTTHDGWDIDANYTWFQIKKHQVFNVPGFGSAGAPFYPSIGQLALLDPWINPQNFNNSPAFTNPAFDTIQALWRLKLNQIDLDLGRKYWLGQFTAMRPYIGIRGAWFTTRFNNVASSNAVFSSTYTFNTFSDKFKNNIWGVGLIGGFQPEWHFCQNFLLFSNLDVSLLWGKFKTHKNENYTSFNPSGVATLNFQNFFNNIFFKMQAVLDLGIGLRWEETWCYRIRTYLDIGWEYHFWFDVNNRIKYQASFAYGTGGGNVSGFQSFNELAGNLMISGGVVRFRVDF